MLELIIYLLDFIITIRNPLSSSVQIRRAIEYMKSAAYEVLPPNKYSWEFPNWQNSSKLIGLVNTAKL